MLDSGGKPLADLFERLVLDLDGVVYIGEQAIAGVPDVLQEARNRGLSLRYATNNAARSSARVAAHLRQLGLPAQPEEVVTSAAAGAQLLAELVPTGTAVFVVGSTDLQNEVREVGLVLADAQQAEAVIQGYSPDLPWRTLSAACSVLRRDVPWVATNLDATIPTEFGIGPGNGAMVDLLANVVRRRPDAVAGKPEPGLLRVAAADLQSLVVGDRLDTDILGARRAGLASLLVLSGVTSVADLLRAGPEERPDYLAHDVSGIFVIHPEVEVQAQQTHCAGWTFSQNGQLSGAGDDLAAIRAACGAVWQLQTPVDQAIVALRAHGVAA